jgi:ABC-type Fe3+-hydroxamate transport system substrate-binding protein
LPVLLFAGLLAACGSSGTTTGNTNTTATGTAATACLSVTTGTIESFSNNTLQVTNLQGKNVQVTLTDSTILTRQATLTATGLKTGLPVTVIVKQNTDGSYSALSVSARTSQGSLGSLKNGNGERLCSGQRRGTGKGNAGSGTPGAFGNGTGTSRQTINGTISQINSSAIIVTDASGNDFTVTLTSTTRVTEQQTATASDLQVGQAVTITGTANSRGGINATVVALLQALPTRRGAPTPTSTPATNA